MFLHNVICPISNIRVDSNVSRMIAFMNAALLALYVLTGTTWLVAIVALDYGIRALWQLKYSPIRFLAIKSTNALDIPAKPIDLAPKLFASRIGFLFATTSALLIPINDHVSLIVAGVLVTFATLEAAFDLCVGCLTYTYIVLPFYKFMGIRA
jgi:hypothetical protein